ncbi:DUF4097 and DUF4098 domain-containing protein YvlB [Nocardioides salarius]|uniref:DUF4097 and DUF4098 domain-containing protein YvlB n=1 Tax=Nocardioides salarius TaxID=374513 RepID=A0ABS2MBM5_9ACTN|nr:DUF4097 family beta strand repeat-containing protein [Nocardioides salarius]MBM7508581.1 DUF4097 and DUF4098 domain-containing protein YvlB [Nocardioides salarius]
MTHHELTTPDPVDLHVEIGSGLVHLDLTDRTGTTTVRVEGRDAAQVAVDHDGGTVSVVAPRRGLLGAGTSPLQVHVSAPPSSRPAIRTGSAGVVVEGVAGATRVRTGSGDVRLDVLEGESSVETGSGDLGVEHARAGLRVKTGSGQVLLGDLGADATVSTGSGDVRVRRSAGAFTLKTGSGDLRVDEAGGDVSMSSGSGDLLLGRITRGRVDVKGASGALRVGVAPGTPVWADVRTLSGRIHSALPPTGAPADGQDHVEVHGVLVSGDVTLHEA